MNPPNPTCQRFASLFSAYARERGEALARDGIVVVVRSPLRMLLEMDADAPPRGAYPFDAGTGRAHERDLVHVELEVQHDVVVLFCSCPLFALGLDGCRHLWAAFVHSAAALRLAIGPLSYRPRRPGAHVVPLPEPRGKCLCEGTVGGATGPARRRDGGAKS